MVSGKGYTFQKNQAISTKILAWCDDLAIFTENAEDMTEAMKQVAMFCNYSGMEVNIKKTLLQSSEPDRVRIPYMEGLIEEIPKGESVKYLGIWVNMNLNWMKATEAAIFGVRKKILQIKNRRLDPDI